MGGESAAVVYADRTRAYRVREGTLSLERGARDETETSRIQARRKQFPGVRRKALVNPERLAFMKAPETCPLFIGRVVR